MRVAVAFRDIAARSGGAERVAVELINELVARGFEVDLVSCEEDPSEPFYPLAPEVRRFNLHGADGFGMRVLRGKFLRKRGKKSNVLKWISRHGGYVSALRSYLRRNRPDVLLPFMPSSMTVAALAATGTGIPVVASTHNEPSQDFENPKRWDANPVDVFLRTKLLRRFRTILVLLPTYRDWYPKKLHDRIEVIPNPVIPIDQRLRASAKRKNRILAVGRLTTVKRLDALIEAWGLLHKDFPEWSVHIYGEGPEKSRLCELRDSFNFGEGSLVLEGTTTEIMDAYLGSRLFCHPARFEGFPLCVCEALAAGLPVIGFEDCSGLNSLVVDGQNGLLVQADSDRAEALARSLKRVLQDEKLRDELSQNAPPSVEVFAPKAIYDLWERAIRNAVSAGSSAHTKFSR